MKMRWSVKLSSFQRRWINWISALALAGFLFSDASGAGAAVLDPQSNGSHSNSLLRLLDTALDPSGIDIRLGHAGVNSEASIADRPQLTPLVAMPGPSDEKVVEATAFSRLFLSSVQLEYQGVHSALLAVGTPDRTSVRSQEDFQTAWERAPRDKRVFVSFTRTDYEAAKKVAASLQESGYAVFTYIAGEDDSIWTNSVEVGRYFAEAHHRLVLDTPAARASEPTQVERAAALLLMDAETKALRTLSKDEIAMLIDNAIEMMPVEASNNTSRSGSSGGCCRFCASASACEKMFLSEPVCSSVVCGVICGNAF